MAHLLRRYGDNHNNLHRSGYRAGLTPWQVVGAGPDVTPRGHPFIEIYSSPETVVIRFQSRTGFLERRDESPSRSTPVLSVVSIPCWVSSSSRPTSSERGSRCGIVSIPKWFVARRDPANESVWVDAELFQSRSGFLARCDDSHGVPAWLNLLMFQSRSGFLARRDSARPLRRVRRSPGFNPALGF